MRLKSYLLAGLAALLVAGPARADTTLSLVEVITSPERTETLKQIVKTFEDANPGVHVEITSLPWGQAFEKFATMVSAGDTPDVVEMPDRWQALYANNGMLENLEPYLATWDHTKELSDRTMQMARYVGNTAYALPYGFYLRAMFINRVLFKQAGIEAAPTTMDEFTADAKKISALPGKYGYCLRGGPGGLNGWVMFGAGMNGDNSFFQKDGTSTFADPGWVKGVAWLVDLYKNGYAPKDSVNWGFNEIVAGFYSSTCAMLDQDPDALIAVQERMKPEEYDVVPFPKGPAGKAFPTIGYGSWAMFSNSKNKDLSWKLIATLDGPRGQCRLEQADRGAADLQIRREGPLLRQSEVQGLVRGAGRQGRDADRHAHISAGIRLFRRCHRGQDEPAGPARPALAGGYGQAMGRLPDHGAEEISRRQEVT